MGSIWDAPVPSGDSAPLSYDSAGVRRTDPPSVPTADDSYLFGTANGPLLTSAGRGVVNGRPYGEALQTEKQVLMTRHRFWPTAQARLAAASRKALGR